MKKTFIQLCWVLAFGHAILTCSEAEILDSLAEFGNAGTADEESAAGIARGADFTNAAAGAYSITAGGTDFWGNSDNGSFIYDADVSRAADENFSVIVRSVSVAADGLEGLAGEWGRTGIMARKTPDAANSANVAHIRKSGGDSAGTNPADTLIQGRPTDAAATDRGPGENGEHRNFEANTENGSVSDTPIWLGLHRYEGEWYSTWASDSDGSPGTWSEAIQRQGTPDLAGQVWVGLVHQSHNIHPEVNTADFDNFSVAAFDPLLGDFPLSYTCDVAFTGSDVFLTAFATEIGGSEPQDISWEARYIGNDEVPTPGGLLADIYMTGNGGNFDAFESLVLDTVPSGSTRIEQIRWAANAYTTTNAAGKNLFAEAVQGSFLADQDNYGVNVTGEIHIPSDEDRDGVEEILFHDGVDDYCYLEIDGEILIDDNIWSNVNGDGNGGGAQVIFDASDSKYNDGEWVTFRLITWEGGGGDDAILVWDALDRTGNDSVTGGTDDALDSYGGAGLDEGEQIPFIHDLSDVIPASNFRSPAPEILLTVSGTGQPDNLMIDQLPEGTVAIEVYANGELCATVPLNATIQSADFTAANEITVVIKDAGSGGSSDVDPDSISVTLDDNDIAASVTKEGLVTTITYTFADPPAPYTLYQLNVAGATTAETGEQDLEFSQSLRSWPILAELRAGLDPAPNATEGWDYMEFDVLTTLGGNLGATAQGFIDAQLLISTAEDPDFQEVQPFINHADPDTNSLSGDWGPDLPILMDQEGVDDNQYVTYARTVVTIEEGQQGDYTFRIRGDDGYGMRVTGGEFTSITGNAINVLDSRDPSVAFFPDFTGDSNAFAVCNFPTAGDYLIEFFGFEGGGGSYQELSWAKGSFTSLSGSNSWALVGNVASNPPTSAFGEIPEEMLPPAPSNADDGWSYYIWYDATVGSLNATMDFILNTAFADDAETGFLSELNHSDDGVDAGRINPTDPFPDDPIEGGDTDNIAMVARAFVVAPVDGDYTLQVRSDDGFLLRWADTETAFHTKNGGGVFLEAIPNEVFFPAGTGDSDTRAAAFLTAGVHELHFVWWEGGGGSHFEITSVPGVETSQDASFETLTTGSSSTHLYLGTPGAVPTGFFQITNVDYDPIADTFTLTWNSVDGAVYSIHADTDISGFEQEVNDSVDSNGETTTFGPFANPFPDASQVYLRVGTN